MIGGNEYILASTPIAQSQLPSQTKITFSPTSSEVKVKFKYGTSAWTWHGHSICITKPVMVSETYYVDVCDGGEDKYRFGFAAGEKINEIAGIGNYVDLGERGVDTRIARLNWRPDPLAAKFPYQCPYVYAGNSPIIAIDKKGKEIWIMELKSTGEAIERVQYIDGKLYDKQGNEVTTNNKYINEIKSILDNIINTSMSVGHMITEMQNQKGIIHNIQNFDPIYDPSTNRNYSISIGTRTIFNSSGVQSYSTPEVTLAHELKHGYDRSLKQLRENKIQGKTSNFIEGEWDAINVQNQILHNQGKLLRYFYDGIKIPDEEFVQPKDNDMPKNKPISENKPMPDSKSNTNENTINKKGYGTLLDIGDGKGGIITVDPDTYKK